MDHTAHEDLLRAVSAAREQAFAAQEKLTGEQSAQPAAADALVAVQSAANQLGVAEDMLARLVGDASAVPAPILDPDGERRGDEIRWSYEAAVAQAFAEFTVPYASTSASEVERWLRVLRRDGVVGRALTELGFPDGQISVRAESAARPPDNESVEMICAQAVAFARKRSAETVTTTDLLFAVLAVYGRLVDRVLYARGVSREELLAQVADGVHLPAAVR